MKKNFFVLAAILLVFNCNFCNKRSGDYHFLGKKAYIDTDRPPVENTMKQVIAIDDVLCG